MKNKNFLNYDLINLISSYSNVKISYQEKFYLLNYLEELFNNNLIKKKEGKIYFVVNKFTQYGHLFLFKNGDFYYLATDKVSTGNPEKTDFKNNKIYFDTPISVIDRKNFVKGDWLSSGGNYGYGSKGNKIFFLGEYRIPIKNKYKRRREFHFAMHSTNPIQENFLGNKSSQGCIRISNELNFIFKKLHLLNGINGRYVIVLDSSLSIEKNIKFTKKFKKLKIISK